MGFRTEFFNTLNKLWQSKWIKFGIIMNFMYMIAGLIYFYLPKEISSDFSVYYRAGELAIVNIESIYNTTEGLFPFRYLPLSAYFFSIFTIFPEPIAFFIYTLINFMLNIIVIVLIYQILFNMFQIKKKFENHTYRLIMVYLIYGPQLDNYFTGQINLFVMFFLLASLNFFEYNNYSKDRSDKPIKHSDLLGSLCLALAILTKITALVLIPFVIAIDIHLKQKKEGKSNSFIKRLSLKIPIKTNIRRLIFPFIILAINAFMFLANPDLLDGFININFSGSGEQVWNHSFSITRITLNIIMLFTGGSIPFKSIFIMLLFFVPLFGIVFINYIKYINKRRNLSMYYALGLLTLLVGYYDSWAHHLVVLAPFMLINIILIKSSSEISKQEKANKSTALLYQVNAKEYKHIHIIWLGSGLYFWTLFYFFTEYLFGNLFKDFFYEGAPGLNIFYCIIVSAMFIKLIKIIRHSS